MDKVLKLFLKKLTAIFLIILVVFSAGSPVYASSLEQVFSVNDVINKTSEYMMENAEYFSGAWSVTGLARSDVSVKGEYYNNYYEALKAALEENEGVLSKRKYTEYSAAVIALTAIDKDPSCIGGYNLFEKLSDFNNVVYQGINGPIYALLALDAGGYDFAPLDGIINITTREKLIDYILAREIAGGGWSMGEDTPDPDVTAMALQSLSKYKDMPKVKQAINRGLKVLSNIQKNDGGYESWGTYNSESNAQVIIALCSLDINPVTDEDFIKNGNNVLMNFIDNFYVESKGGFGHVDGTDIDLMATNQGFSALVAYDRFIKDKASFYDISDVEKNYSEKYSGTKFLEGNDYEDEKNLVAFGTFIFNLIFIPLFPNI